MWANEWGEVESESFLAPTPPSTDQPRIFHYLQSYFGLVLLHALVLTSVVIEAGLLLLLHGEVPQRPVVPGHRQAGPPTRRRPRATERAAALGAGASKQARLER